MRRERHILGWGRRAALLGALLLPLLGLGVGARTVRADDEAPEDASIRAYAREQLILNANESVDPARRAAGRLDELKTALFEKRDVLVRADSAAFGRLIKLLGEPKHDGLIRQGAVLYRWMAGIDPEPTPAASVIDDEADDLLTREIPVPHLVNGRLAVPGTEALIAASRSWDALVGYAKAESDPEKAMPAWLRSRILALVDARELRAPIVTQGYLDARKAQVAARVADYQADRPARGLVSEGTVREKAERAERTLKPAGPYEQRLLEIEQALDRMARAEGMLKEDAGQLGFQLEAAKRRREALGKDGDEAAVGVADLELERLQLEEIVDQQQLRLLYITVRRAVLATRLFGAALEQVKAEAQAADRAHQAYESELIRMRRARQLDRLDFVMARLKAERKRMAAVGAKREGEAKAILTAYDGALEHLMAVSRLTREAVTMRRALEARVKPHQGADDTAPTTREDERGCLPDETEAEAAARKAKVARTAADDPLRRFRHPDPESITANYVRDATKVLNDPAWSAALAAAHHDAVKTRIAALEEALGLVAAADDLEARFKTARAAAAAALDAVETSARGQGSAAGWWLDRVRRRRDQDLVRDAKSFTETLHGIREERKAIQDDLARFRAYRGRLLGLGTRSFQIRVERTLDPDRLAEAYADTGAALGEAGRWVTLQGKENAGTFLGGHWKLILACLGVLVASIFFVRLGRRTLDGALRRLAHRVPALRSEPVTVRAEEAHAKREKALQEARAKAAEEEALREVSKEEADRQQRMGEGGYGGGDE